MKILITGGSGFIGKPLVLDLLSHNHEIYLLARSKSINAVNKTFIGHPIFFSKVILKIQKLYLVLRIKKSSKKSIV